LVAAKADMQFSIVQNELSESNPELLAASNTASNFINKSLKFKSINKFNY
jgi:hypothetical protein